MKPTLAQVGRPRGTATLHTVKAGKAIDLRRPHEVTHAQLTREIEAGVRYFWNKRAIAYHPHTP